MGADLTFVVSPRLVEGENELLFVATDRAGNETREIFVVNLDTTAPIVRWTDREDGDWTNQTRLKIQGTASEPVTMTLQGADIPVSVDLRFNTVITLAEGENLLTFLAADRAGNEAQEIFRVQLDTTPPSAPQVQDDGVVTRQDSRLAATWTSSRDDESGVASYEVGLGSVPKGQPVPGDPNLVAWRDVALATSVIFDNLRLVEDRDYYFLVRAINAAGDASQAAASDGIAYAMVRPPRLKSLDLPAATRFMEGDPAEFGYAAVEYTYQELSSRVLLDGKEIIAWTRQNPARWVPVTSDTGMRQVTVQIRNAEGLTDEQGRQVIILRRPRIPAASPGGAR